MLANPVWILRIFNIYLMTNILSFVVVVFLVFIETTCEGCLICPFRFAFWRYTAATHESHSCVELLKGARELLPPSHPEGTTFPPGWRKGDDSGASARTQMAGYHLMPRELCGIMYALDMNVHQHNHVVHIVCARLWFIAKGHKWRGSKDHRRRLDVEWYLIYVLLWWIMRATRVATEFW